MKDALLGTASPEDGMAIVYALVRGYENGDWDTVVQQAEDLEASAAEIGKIYVESVRWAAEVLAAGL